MSEPDPIEPTHTCFDDAMEFFEMLRLDEPGAREYATTALRLVHGICMAGSGERYVHAWVEEHVGNDPERAHWPREVVWQGMRYGAGKGWFAVPSEWFYQVYQVQERELYTVQRFAMFNMLTGHYGPWNPRYFAMMEGVAGGRLMGRVEGASPLGFVLPDGGRDGADH